MLNEKNENNNESGNHSHTGLYIVGGTGTAVALGGVTLAVISGRKTRKMVLEDREMAARRHTENSQQHSAMEANVSELRGALTQVANAVTELAKSKP